MTPPRRIIDPLEDQRRARTYAEVQAEKTRIHDEHMMSNAAAPGYWLAYGAFIALAWVLSDDEDSMPLEDRLRNAAG